MKCKINKFFLIPFLITFLFLTVFLKNTVANWTHDNIDPAVTIDAIKCGESPTWTDITNGGTCNQPFAYVIFKYTELNTNDSGLKTESYTINGSTTNLSFTGTTYMTNSPPVQIQNVSGLVRISASATDNAGNIGNYTDGVDFEFEFYFPFTITGNVFIDENKDGKKNGSDYNYNGTPVITLLGGTGTVTTSPGGTYTITGLINGPNYTVRFTPPSLPVVYYPTYPNFVPPQYSVTFPCTDNPTPPPCGSFSPCANPSGQHLDASCSGSGIINLNFGIISSTPWFQCVGADCRKDDLTGGFTDPIPKSDESDVCVANYPSSYASVPGPMSNTPGIIFTGSTGPNLGQGKASDPDPAPKWNWQVGGSLYGEVFQPVRNSVIRTSYSYVDTSLRQSGITPIPLSTTECGAFGITNCNLSSTLANGVYISGNTYPSNLTLAGSGSPPYYVFPNNKDYLFLVNGNLNINTKIIVPVGSTATFIVKGNITIDKSVGGTATTICDPTLNPNHTDPLASPPFAGCHIEGFYSTDGSFIANGNSPSQCPSTPDLRLNVSGGIVVNAGLTTGTLSYNRDLCDNSLICPSLSIVERPDMVLNAPEILKHQTYVWQEVAP